MARTDMAGFWWDDTPPPKPPKAEKPKRTPPERTWERPDYLPNLQEAMAFGFNMMTPEEMFHAAVQRHRVVFDVECYVNYFLVMFKSMETGKIMLVESYQDSPMNLKLLEWAMQSFYLFSFNGIHYDVPMVSAAIAGKSCAQLKWLSQEIIGNGTQPYVALRTMKVKQLKDLNHVDMINHAPVGTGLKKCGARLYTPMMQDLPFHHETILSVNQALIVRWYCGNDLVQTELLARKLEEPLALREQLGKEYGIDLRSKSDAQIAEAVIAEEVRKLNGNRPQTPTIPPGTAYKYKVPQFLRYASPLMNWVLDTVRSADFVVSEQGSIGMPEQIKGLEIKIGNSVYRMGIGGLHSSEKTAAHIADDHTMLVDRDVTSFYPFIILLLGLYPPHLGPNFLKVYRKLVERRLEAKKSGNTVVADALKITINGSYGKLASPFSVLYSPDLQIQVTVTGQLVLLMLIERLELVGIPVVSANTDGIVIKCPRARAEELNAIIAQWERDTGFETEETRYKALYSRDVNNYIAVYETPKKKGDKLIETKTKGVYADPGLQKDPSARVCVDAVLAAITKQTPIDKLIRECKDIRKFISVRNVPGGAVKVWSRKPAPAHNTKEELLKIAGFYPVEGGMWRHPSYGENLAVFTVATAYSTALAMLETPDHTEYLGKTVRWYYAAGEKGDIVKAINGNSVSLSEGGKPVQRLPEQFPEDIDYDWYIAQANKILVDIGYAPKVEK